MACTWDMDQGYKVSWPLYGLYLRYGPRLKGRKPLYGFYLRYELRLQSQLTTVWFVPELWTRLQSQHVPEIWMQVTKSADLWMTCIWDMDPGYRVSWSPNGLYLRYGPRLQSQLISEWFVPEIWTQATESADLWIVCTWDIDPGYKDKPLNGLYLRCGHILPRQLTCIRTNMEDYRLWQLTTEGHVYKVSWFPNTTDMHLGYEVSWMTCIWDWWKPSLFIQMSGQNSMHTKGSVQLNIYFRKQYFCWTL